MIHNILCISRRFILHPVLLLSLDYRPSRLQLLQLNNKKMFTIRYVNRKNNDFNKKEMKPASGQHMPSVHLKTTNILHRHAKM